MTRPLHCALDAHARELAALSRVLERIAAPHGGAHDTALLPLAESATSCLARAAPELSEVLATQIAACGYPAALIEGLPTAPRASTSDALLCLGLAHLLGEVFNFRQQYQAASMPRWRLVNHLIPTGRKPHGPSGQSREAHTWHTDDYYLDADCRPDIIVLLGLHNERDTATRLSFADDVWAHLDRTSVRVLGEPRYTVALPASYELPDEHWSGRRALLWEDTGGPCCGLSSIPPRPFDPADREATRALEALYTAIERVEQRVIIRAGTMLVFHNRRVIHARVAVEGHREVLRAYVRPDLRALMARCGEPGPLFDISPLLCA